MGYQTYFYGEIKVEPPLSIKEQEFLNRFAQTRRVVREGVTQDKYYIESGPEEFWKDTSVIVDMNNPPDGQPGLWCNWSSSSEGNITWNGAEKFYNSQFWMVYIIEHFFKKDCYLESIDPEKYNRFELQPHDLNGVIYAKGESVGDIWKIIVENNEVYVSQGNVHPHLLAGDMSSESLLLLDEDDLDDIQYESWSDLEVSESVANWGSPTKLSYKPVQSDLFNETISRKVKKLIGR